MKQQFPDVKFDRGGDTLSVKLENALGNPDTKVIDALLWFLEQTPKKRVSAIVRAYEGRFCSGGVQ